MKLFKRLTALFVVMVAFVTVLSLTNVEAAHNDEITISFSTTANRTSQTTSQQIWEQNGIKVTNNKSSSTSNIIDSSNPVRFYKNSELIVEYTTTFSTIKFDCNSATYATNLVNSIGSGATASADIVTVVLDTPATTYTVASLSGGQVRMDAITLVEFVEGGAITPTIGISGTAYAMVGDPSVTLESQVTNADEATVIWTSNNENVATVLNGVVTPVNEGKTTITATIDGTEVSTTAEFIVYPDNSEEITIAKALEICTLTGSSQTPYNYSATGQVKSTSATQYGVNVIITDGTNEITAYGLTNGEDAVVGTRITVTGKLINYNNYTPEFNSGCTFTVASYDKDSALSAFSSQTSKSSLRFGYSYVTEEVEAESKYQLVTNVSDLKEGDKVVIAATGTNNYALSTTQNNNNRGQASITREGNNISFNDDVQILTVSINESGYYTFYTGEGYLYAAGSSTGNNYLRTTANNTDLDAQWTIAIDANGNAAIQAQGDAARDIIKYNSTNSLFSCYASGQNEVCLYKEVTVGSETKYTVNTVDMRFGAMISVDLYEALVAAGTEVEFGVVALKASTLENDGKTLADYIETNNYICTAVRVNAEGVADENGDYYQFALVINSIPMTDLDVEITAACYVSIDGEVTLMGETTESVRSVANSYLTNGIKAEYVEVMQYIAEYTQE